MEIIIGDPQRFDPRECRALLNKHRMEISCINCGGINYVFKESLVNADSAKEKAAMRKLEIIVGHCAALGCLAQVGVARGAAIEGMPRPRFRDRLVGRLKEVCACAADAGVTVVFEYTTRFEINTINTFDEARDLIDRVCRPNLGLLLDTYHSFLEDDPDVYETLYRARLYLKHLHFHDSNRGPAGAAGGELDFDRILTILKEIGYQGWLSDGLVTTSLPHEQVRRSTSYLRETIARLGL